MPTVKADRSFTALSACEAAPVGWPRATAPVMVAGRPTARWSLPKPGGTDVLRGNPRAAGLAGYGDGAHLGTLASDGGGGRSGTGTSRLWPWIHDRPDPTAMGFHLAHESGMWRRSGSRSG